MLYEVITRQAIVEILTDAVQSACNAYAGPGQFEAGRLLTLQSAWLIDQGKNASKFSSFAKCFSTDMAMEVSTNAVQVFGGNGYTIV